jgi:hypothetical protein
MNLKERNMILRVYKALDAVPGANIGGGTNSVTVSGVANFARDIAEVRHHCGRALMILCDGDPDMSAAQRNQFFNDHMSGAEAYIERRKALGWKAQ